MNSASRIFFGLIACAAAACSSIGPGDESKDLFAPAPAGSGEGTAPTDPTAGTATGSARDDAAEPGDAPPAPPTPSSNAGAPPPSSGCTSVSAFPAIVEQRTATSEDAHWADLGKAGANDGQAASAVLDVDYYYSADLLARGFDLDVPTGATIKGLTVEVTRQASAAKTFDAVFRLAKKTNSSVTKLGEDASRSDAWPVGAYATVTYGAADSLWGASLTPAIVNAPSFTVQLAATNDDLGDGDEATVRIDAIKVTVHYCL